MTTPRLTRRGMLAAAAALPLAACDRFSQTPAARNAFDVVNDLTYRVQRLLLGANRLAPEFSRSDISANFKANGSIDPQGDDYKKLAAEKFMNWRLEIGGLVEHPLKIGLAELRTMPARTQITRHDCVEGWSCIGEWTGVPLAHVLEQARPKPQARFLAFHCADSPDRDSEEGGSGSVATLDGSVDLYYETIDLEDARHPQTILAYEMNGKPLPVAHGAPLRLRLERQLGYKMAKFIMRIELVDSFDDLGQGRGGYWEDRGYDWYAGI